MKQLTFRDSGWLMHKPCCSTLTVLTDCWKYLTEKSTLLFCCCFTSLQHLRLYKDGYRLLTMCAYSDFYSAAPLGKQAVSTMTWYCTPVTLSWHWANQSFPYSNNAEHQAKSGNNQFDKLLVWLDRGLNQRSPARETSALLIQPPRPHFSFCV